MMSFAEFKDMFSTGFVPEGDQLYLPGENGVSIKCTEWPQELMDYLDSMEKDEDGRYSDEEVAIFLNLADESEDLWKTAYEKYTEQE